MNASLESLPELGAFGVGDLVDHNPIVGAARTGARRFWTGAEEKVLRAVYAQGGVAAAVPALPGRSAAAIYNRANQLKLKTAREASPRERWANSPQIDEAIRRVYQGAPRSGDIKQLALNVGRPRGYVSTRARALGLTQPRFKEPNWTGAEIAIVVAHASMCLQSIQRRLKRAGFARTATAIKVRLKRLGADRRDDDRCNARELSQLFGVDQSTVVGWIEKGWLKARHIDADKTLGKGRNWSIHVRDVRRFVIDNVAAVDVRKVEKFWFVDLIAGGGP